MCGLFGWQVLPGKVSVAQRAIAACILATENERRGRESWGWYDGRFRYRGVGAITDTDEAVRMAESDFVLGHTRLATMGKLTVENCHPFKIGHIVGAHNGVVYNSYELDWEYNRDFAVDSMHIFQHINDKRQLDDIEAYGAITYVDTRHRGRVHLGRFNGGMLSVYRIRDEKTGDPVGIMWSSESTPLIMVADMTGLDMVPVEIKLGDMYEIWAGEVWKSNATIAISDHTPDSKSGWTYNASTNSFGKTSSSPYSSSYATAYEKNKDETDGNRRVIQQLYNNRSWCTPCSSYNSDDMMCYLCDRCFYCCKCVETERIASVDDRLSYSDLKAWNEEVDRSEAEFEAGPKETVKTISGPVASKLPKVSSVKALHLPFTAPIPF